MWLSLGCTALLIAVQMLRDIGGGLVCLVSALSWGRKEIRHVCMEQEERIGCCEEKPTDCCVLNMSNLRWNFTDFTHFTFQAVFCKASVYPSVPSTWVKTTGGENN